MLICNKYTGGGWLHEFFLVHTDAVVVIIITCTFGGEAFTCLRQFLTYRAATITLTMICYDLRLKSKTVLMF